MKLALVVPVWRRFALTNQILTYYHALELPGASVRLVIVGSEGRRSRAVARGLDYVEAPNAPLDAKYDAGIEAAGRLTDFRPDAVALVGSDDFFTPRYFQWGLERIGRGAGLVGLRDLLLVDLLRTRILYWPGYRGDRAGAPVGSGMMWSAAMLDAVGWRPFFGPYQHWFRDDERAVERCVRAGGTVETTNMARIGCQMWAVKSGTGEFNPVSSFEASSREQLVDVTTHTLTLFRRTVPLDPCFDGG
jgi:hypothetical protein